jgi:hypothetical protein
VKRQVSGQKITRHRPRTRLTPSLQNSSPEQVQREKRYPLTDDMPVCDIGPDVKVVELSREELEGYFDGLIAWVRREKGVVRE